MNEIQIKEQAFLKAIGEYLENIENYPIVKQENKIKINHRKIRLRKISKIIFDKNEDNLDKLTTIFSTINSTNSDIFYIFHNDENHHLHFYVGVASDDIRTLNYANETLAKTFLSNFNGCEVSETIKANDEEMTKLNDVFQEKYFNISATTALPSLKSEKERKEKFTQGLEKFLLAMQDERYTMILLAKNISDVIQVRKKGLEELYSSLYPLANIDYTTGENASFTEGESITETWSKTINNSVSKTIQDPSEYQKWQQSVPIIGGALKSIWEILKAGKRLVTMEGDKKEKYNNTFKSHNETTTHSEAEMRSRANTKNTSITTGTSSQITLKTENKTIKEYLDNIEKQLEKIHNSQNYGMYDFAAYFIAPTKSIASNAASIYNSLIKGEDSYISPSYIINFDNEKSKEISKYLINFEHPKFEIDGEKVSITSMVNSKDLAIAMGLPKKSLPGLYIKESVEFAREIIARDKKNENKYITIGHIYHLGKIQENDRVTINLDDLTMHTLIAGSTGSGKSNTTYKIVDEVRKKGIKFLVIEPTKGEYKHIFGNDENVKVYGTNIKYTPMLKINPFSFPYEEIHVLEHIDRLVEIFNACWPMYAAMPAVLKDAILHAYERCGWNLDISTCEKNVFPTFENVLTALDEIIDNSSYSDELKANYKGALSTRIESLTKGLIGQIFTKNELSQRELFDENVIIDISRIGSSETKSLIMGVLLLKLNEYRMLQNEINSDLKHITILEEAHHLLPRVSKEVNSESGNIKGKAVEMLSNTIAEMRTYGEGFIIVDQSPNMIDISAIRNTNTKILLRLSEIEDKNDIGKAMALNEEQIIEIPKLEQGVAIVYQNGWEEAVLCKIDKIDLNDSRYKYETPTLIDKKRLNKDVVLAVLNTQIKSLDYKLDIAKIKNWIDNTKKEEIIKDLQLNNTDLKKAIEYINYILKSEKIKLDSSMSSTEINQHIKNHIIKQIGFIDDFIMKTLITFVQYNFHPKKEEFIKNIAIKLRDL